MSNQDLPGIANNIRIDMLKMLQKAGSGHTAGPLGITDVLTALYFGEMNIDPERPNSESRDRFVLSPAHMVPALYTTLAHRGFFPVSELDTLRKFGSRLQGHTFRNLEIGVETTGGSLAQGFSIALGFALSARMDRANWRTYCLISDGELDEGETWEALMFGAKEGLDNMCVILDRNLIQQSNYTRNVMPTTPVLTKLEAFGWHVLSIDGHDYNQIQFALAKARQIKGKPTLILSHTTAGKGVSFIENKWEWHGKVPNEAELKLALAELNAKK